MVNKLTKKSKSKKQSNKQSKRKLKTKLSKKQGGNLNEYLEGKIEDPTIVYTNEVTEFVKISEDNFKKLLLINSFYEIYSEIEEPSKTPATRLKNNNPVKRPKTEGIVPINLEEFLRKGGDFSKFNYKLLACLDNIHDFAGNNRCSVSYNGDHQKSFKKYIFELYENIGLNEDEISEYNLKEGLILYKILEEYPKINDNMVFKMNKFFLKKKEDDEKKSNKRGRNNSNNINSKNEYNEYIIQEIVIPPHLDKQQCVLYDSPVSKLKESHLIDKKNIVSTIIAIKNNKEKYETPPEKLFDSGTSYNKGVCNFNKKQKSIDYNIYPLFQLGGNSIEFCKCDNKLSYKDNCSLYNLSNGYSLRQLKEWIINNIEYFDGSKINNPLVNKSHLTNGILKNFINELCSKLKKSNSKNTNKSNTRNNTRNKFNNLFKEGNEDLLKFYVAMSIKRLGDWGMVERSIKNNNIFITNDTLCALYAITRDAKMIFHVPSTYSNNIKIPGLMQESNSKNMGLIGCYNYVETNSNTSMEVNNESIDSPDCLKEYIDGELIIIKNIINEHDSQLSNYQEYKESYNFINEKL